MIPLRDNLRARFIPITTILLIIINMYSFFYQLSGDISLQRYLIHTYGMIPAKVLANIDAGNISVLFSLLTNLFLHGGWLHIIGNMWYLWLFGDNVEDWLGRFSFLVFYLLCGFIANISHILLDPSSSVPTIGASGAVSGVLGAYVVLYPRARIKTLIPIFIFLQVLEIPATLFLGFWFLMQLKSGTLALFNSGTNIAWWAHIGGFIAGMLLIKIFPCRCKPSHFEE